MRGAKGLGRHQLTFHTRLFDRFSLSDQGPGTPGPTEAFLGKLKIASWSFLPQHTQFDDQKPFFFRFDKTATTIHYLIEKNTPNVFSALICTVLLMYY